MTGDAAAVCALGASSGEGCVPGAAAPLIWRLVVTHTGKQQGWSCSGASQFPSVWVARVSGRIGMGLSVPCQCALAVPVPGSASALHAPPARNWPFDVHEGLSVADWLQAHGLRLPLCLSLAQQARAWGGLWGARGRQAVPARHSSGGVVKRGESCCKSGLGPPGRRRFVPCPSRPRVLCEKRTDGSGCAAQSVGSAVNALPAGCHVARMACLRSFGRGTSGLSTRDFYTFSGFFVVLMPMFNDILSLLQDRQGLIPHGPAGESHASTAC